MKTLILFLATLMVLVAGALTVLASPTYKLSAARPTPSPLFVIGQPAATPIPTAPPARAPPPAGIVTFNVPVYKQLRNLDCETVALQMALGALGISYTQNQLIAMQHTPDTRSPV